MPDFAEQLVMDTPVAEQPAPAPEAAPPAADPAQPDRPRNADGTFAPKAKDEGSETGVKQEAAPPQQAPAASEPPTDEESPHVPRTALLDERRKRQSLEAELAELRKPKPEQPQQPPANPPNPSPATPTRPDFSFDPSQFEDNPQGFYDARLHKTKMDMSLTVAIQQFGESAVNEAYAALDQAAAKDPSVSAYSWSLRDHPHPIGEVVQWHRKQLEVRQLTEAGGLDKLTESIRAKVLAELQGQTPGAAAMPGAVPMPRPATPAPPPSLAKGGAGQSNAPEAVSDNEVFEAIFDKSKRLSRKR